MASELCMNCFSVKGQYEVCPFCGYAEGTPPEQPHYLTPGTILANHFIVGTAIGFGGFGITYKCFDTTLGVIVAVKEFYPVGLVNRAPGESTVGLLSGDKQEQYHAQLKRFLMEAQSIAQFGKAKDIVNVYDFFEANNTAYIIMEYVDGVLLKDYLDRQGRMEPDVALNVITPVIEAVKKIHAKGIIHRDISPDNIFISGEESIKVFDFGAAQLNNSSEGMAGEKVIKVGYSAPEQYRDNSKQGFYTDIYSVGAILYQMVTGIKPMESTEREFKDTLKSPAELGVEIEPNVDRAIMEAMAVRPELRFQSIQQLDDALHSKRIAEYPKVKLKKRKRRRNWIISLAATLVLAVGVSIALFSTVLKEESRIFDTTLTKDTITIWVSGEEEKTILDSVAQNNFVPGKDLGQVSDRVKKMLENNKNITVNVVNIKEKDENATMGEKLREAKQNNTMPDMFLTDYVRDLDSYHLASFEDNVLAEIKREEYLYMSEYEKYFPDMTEMPTGVNTLMLYAKAYKPNAQNTLTDSRFYAKDNKKQSVELDDVTAASKDGSNPEYTYIRTGNTTKMAILKNPSCFAFSTGELNPDTDLVNNLSTYLVDVSNHGKQKSGMFINGGMFSESKGYDKGNSTIEDSSYRSALYTYEQQFIQEGIEKDQVSDYNVMVLTQKGKMYVQYDNRFAINADSSENKQTACMRFMWTLLGKAAQANYYQADSRTPFPINREAFMEFFDYNKAFVCFRDMVKNMTDCILVGNGTSNIIGFEVGLRKNEDSANSETIKEYCQQYVENKKKK